MNGTNDSPRSCDDLPLARGMGILILSLLLVALVLALDGCAKPTRTEVPSYEKAKAAALREGPLSRPRVETRKKLRCADASVALKKGAEVPHDGILITGDKAACLAAIRAERDRLRTEAEARELQMRTRRIISDAAIKRLAEETKRTWWERNGGAVLFATGATVGAAIITGLVFALTRGSGVTPQMHVLPEVRR